jgi:ribosomal 50S subunit-recycling heat shock protein
MSDWGESDETCRIDVWLWRARVFKTRSLAAQFVDAGRLRRTRAGVEQRLDKASRSVRPGDGLVFALGGRVWTLRVAAVGARRGPPQEARALYTALNAAQPTAASFNPLIPAKAGTQIEERQPFGGDALRAGPRPSPG